MPKLQYWPIYLFGVAMFLAWSAWGLVYHKVAVYVSRDIALPLFYSSLFASVFFTTIFFLSLLKLALLADTFLHTIVKNSLRQSLIFSGLIIILVLFEQVNILTLNVGIIAGLMAFFVEAFFWERRPNEPKSKESDNPTLFS